MWDTGNLAINCILPSNSAQCLYLHSKIGRGKHVGYRRFSYHLYTLTQTKTEADPGFPVGGGANPPGDFAKFSKKLHEIENILGCEAPLEVNNSYAKRGYKLMPILCVWDRRNRSKNFSSLNLSSMTSSSSHLLSYRVVGVNSHCSYVNCITDILFLYNAIRISNNSGICIRYRGRMNTDESGRVQTEP